MVELSYTRPIQETKYAISYFLLIDFFLRDIWYVSKTVVPFIDIWAAFKKANVLPWTRLSIGTAIQDRMFAITLHI